VGELGMRMNKTEEESFSLLRGLIAEAEQYLTDLEQGRIVSGYDLLAESLQPSTDISNIMRVVSLDTALHLATLRFHIRYIIGSLFTYVLCTEKITLLTAAWIAKGGLDLAACGA
jgi:hypothetical protein